MKYVNTLLKSGSATFDGCARYFFYCFLSATFFFCSSHHSQNVTCSDSCCWRLTVECPVVCSSKWKCQFLLKPPLSYLPRSPSSTPSSIYHSGAEVASNQKVERGIRWQICFDSDSRELLNIYDGTWSVSFLGCPLDPRCWHVFRARQCWLFAWWHRETELSFYFFYLVHKNNDNFENLHFERWATTKNLGKL